MQYAIIFKDISKIVGRYGSVDDILRLSCFPLPSDLVALEDWQLIDHPPVTRPVCESDPPISLTGMIARYVGR